MASDLSKTHDARPLDLVRARQLRRPGLARAFVVAFGGSRVLERYQDGGVEPLGYREASERRRGSLSTPHVIGAAAEAGFRLVGVSVFWGLVGGIPREEWISDDGVVRISSRRGPARGIERTMAPYYLSTTFDDGCVVLTWGRAPPPIASVERLDSRGGTGELMADEAEHRRAVGQHRERNPSAVPVVVDSIDDCLALAAYFEANIATDVQVRGMAGVILARWGWRSALVVAIGALSWAFVGGLAFP